MEVKEKIEFNYYPIDTEVSQGTPSPENPVFNTPAKAVQNSNIQGAVNGSIVNNGNLQSPNFVRGASGWRLDSTGALYAFLVEVVGKITAGVGSSIASDYLSGIIAQANLNVANRGWTQTSVFTVTDADTVAWGAGTFTSADGTAYSISSGNTGNMAAKTYIYLDTAVSTTVYQTTTTSTTAVGAGKVLIAIAQNGTAEATFQVMQGQGGQNIDAANIVAGSITANEIAASTITAGKLSVAQLAAIAADLGAITAGTITLDDSGHIKGGQTAFDTGDGFFLGAVDSIGTADSYSESNHSNTANITLSSLKYGQSFTGRGYRAYQAKFYLSKTGSPTGNVVAKIYAHSGVFGTSSVPTGAALITSANVDVSTISGSLALVTFTFQGSYTLVNGTKYCVVLESGGDYTCDGSNYISFGYDLTSPTHGGNYSSYDGASWSAFSNSDICFYLYDNDLQHKFSVGNSSQNIKYAPSTGLDLTGLSPQFFNAVVSDTLRTSADNQADTNSASYVKVKEIEYNDVPGSLRVKFTLTNVTGGVTVYGRIYKNGVAVGTERSTSTGAQTFSEDLSFTTDDLIQIYSYATGGSTVRVTNFRIYYDLSGITTDNTINMN